MANSNKTETTIFNQARALLIDLQVNVIQLVPPGGQSPISLTYRPNDKSSRKTVYPDLIAFDEQYLYVGELKPKYSQSDAEKLRLIGTSSDAYNNLCGVARRRFSNFPERPKLALMLLHAQESHPLHSDIFQLVFNQQELKISYGTATKKICRERGSMSSFIDEIIRTSSN